jgi:Uma2 family endonuclease
MSGANRETKLKLYSRRGVREYWIVSWQARQIEVYCRVNAHLSLAATLFESDKLESKLLLGFTCPLSTVFGTMPFSE